MKKYQVKGTTVEHIVLERFERYAYLREHELGGGELMRLLRQLRKGGLFSGHPAADGTQAALFTRLAAAIGALFADPTFELTEDGFGRLAIDHATIDAVFNVSAFETGDYVAQHTQIDPENRDLRKAEFATPAQLAKFLLFWSTRSKHVPQFEELAKAPDLFMPLWLGLLAYSTALSETAHERREALLDYAEAFSKGEIPPFALATAADAFMHCSYMVRKDRHSIKPRLIEMTRKAIEHIVGPFEVGPERIDRGRVKPRVVVAMEWAISAHAMHRVYGDAIASLKNRFEVIGVGRADQMDELAEKAFHRVVGIPTDDFQLSDIVKIVHDLEPDIMYYPSVGMTAWWVAIAAFRMAPIQVLSLGHPATSGSPVMDYVIGEEDVLTDPSCFTERAVLIPSRSLRYRRRPDDPDIKPVVRDTLDEVMVAVPAMVAKLNAPFLRTLVSIANQVTRPVRFVFFPNAPGLALFQARKEIEKWLPKNSIVHGRLNYDKYIDALGACDLHLSPFPFGGTNSNLDSLSVGLPIVAMEGPEPMTMNDAAMLRCLGLGGLVAKTVEQYQEIAVGIINSDSYRKNWARMVIEAPIESQFFAPRTGEAKDAFLRAFVALYNGHAEYSNLPKGEPIIIT